MADKENKSTYEVGAIQALEGIEHVRKRPGMYVGGTDIKALHHLVYEVVDNAFKFSTGGEPVRVATMVSNATCHIIVQDQGRGMTPDQLSKIGPQMSSVTPGYTVDS